MPETSINTLIFACSGGSDVGEIADRAARLLSKQGVGRMVCLAGIGGKVPSTVEKARQAGQILVIDACPQQCARKTLASIDLEPSKHLDLSTLGLTKGSTPVTDQVIQQVADHSRKLLL